MTMLARSDSKDVIAEVLFVSFVPLNLSRR